MTKKIALIGSTGSAGKNVLDIALQNKVKYKIVALAAKNNIDLLEKQARLFQPDIVGVYNKDKALELQKKLSNIRVVAGLEGLLEIAEYDKSEIFFNAAVGAIGIQPTVAAIKKGKKVALANKEVLVAAGAYIMPLARKHNSQIIPVDSEHSAIFQCLNGENPQQIKKIILTASGGPFREWDINQLEKITLKQALTHPNFSMGEKITIDSSTMMNKGLEVIEAHWLFDVKINKIEVLIHPQQQIHGMVEFVDSSIKALISEPNMTLPIQYAMSYPDRLTGDLPSYSFAKNTRFDFFQPDLDKFKCLDLAYQALNAGGTMACYMNAANECLVNRFLSKEISWLDITNKLQRLMEKYNNSFDTSLESILNADSQGREEATLA